MLQDATMNESMPNHTRHIVEQCFALELFLKLFGLFLYFPSTISLYFFNLQNNVNDTMYHKWIEYA